MSRLDKLALATLAGITGWVVMWRGVVWAIDRFEFRLDAVAGDE
jgi:hypothetical protein